MLHPFLPFISFLAHSSSPPSLCSCIMFVGVRSAWAMGGVVVMESVLCYLWAGLQNTHQEVHGWRWGEALRPARHSDQTLQHSRLSWLVPSSLTYYCQPLSLLMLTHVFVVVLTKHFTSSGRKPYICKHLNYYFVLFPHSPLDKNVHIMVKKFFEI